MLLRPARAWPQPDSAWRGGEFCRGSNAECAMRIVVERTQARAAKVQIRDSCRRCRDIKTRRSTKTPDALLLATRAPYDGARAP